MEISIEQYNKMAERLTELEYKEAERKANSMADLISRREAIEDIREYKVEPNHCCDESEIKGYNDGLDTAISALAILPSAQPNRGYIEQIKWERDIAIQQLKELGYGFGEKIPSAQPEIKCIAKVTLTDEQVKEVFEKAKCEILAAQPEWKKGEWNTFFSDSYKVHKIGVECSCCGYRTQERTNYCPNCGADMR